MAWAIPAVPPAAGCARCRRQVAVLIRVGELAGVGTRVGLPNQPPGGFDPASAGATIGVPLSLVMGPRHADISARRQAANQRRLGEPGLAGDRERQRALTARATRASARPGLNRLAKATADVRPTGISYRSRLRDSTMARATVSDVSFGTSREGRCRPDRASHQRP
jgi:hypothetical protein